MFEPPRRAGKSGCGSAHQCRRSLRRRKGSKLDQAELDWFRAVIPLVDGGVADNLGIESVWDSPGALLISDGGRNTAPVALPATNWLSQNDTGSPIGR